MIYALGFIFAFTTVRLLVLLSNLVFRPWLRKYPEPVTAGISVLIPARDEEKNIAGLLGDLLNTADQSLIKEILVYDDQSQDQTAQLVQGFVNQDARIRLIQGGELPEGWKGKNHACYQLAQQAKGDWYLFVDADVRLTKDAIQRALSLAEKERLGLLSVFPYQRMESIGEWLVVPLMNWILISLLPLVLVRTCKWTSFSAANGQFMLFRASIYDRYQWHVKVKNEAVEDILISRMMKKKRIKIATLIGRGEISCRMYTDYSSSIVGFTKNFGQFFGNSIAWMLLFGLLTSSGLILIPVFLGWQAGLIYLFLLMVMRILIALITRQPLIKTLVLAIPQQLVMCLLMIRTVSYRRGKKVSWKGRSV